MNHGTSRRSFLVSASGMVGMGMVGGATAAAAFPSILPASVLGRGGRAGPNDRVGLGLIGCGKRMFEMIGPFLNRPDTRVVAVCDVDTTRREHARSIVDGHYAKSPGSAAAPCVGYNDHREVLARKDVDAVVI
ncbi:MAG: hypothetical protein JNM07_15675, partial [Phycisphaerae bacterium]|nr:hypothetical protein [Phycisphaerae bacterium]